MTTERLYNLLPAIYRQRDAEQGGALRALLAVMESELANLQDDIAGLYDDWFIETAADWVVPYIGDLLGVRSLNSSAGESFNLRAYVANTLAYRRRKGVATMLEQLARDVTGWPASVVEYFERLSTTQHINHVRLHSLRTPNLRDGSAMELTGSPFDRSARSADVRHIRNAGLKPEPVGRYNIPNVGIFLWRLQDYPVERSDARPSAAGPEFFTFHPLGLDQPLFNSPRTETSLDAGGVTALSQEINVPVPLRRRALYAELETLRQSAVDGSAYTPRYFDPDQPVLRVFSGAAETEVPADRILICDLSDWRHPPAAKDYRKADGTTVTRVIEAAVDPVLGRLAFPAGSAPAAVRVCYAYGFSADVGGGPYNRSQSMQSVLRGDIDWHVGVSQRIAAVPGEIYSSLTAAITDWNALPPGKVGLITILDSCTYAETLTGANAVKIPAGSQLVIAAADWPALEDPDMPGVFVRTKGLLVADRLRPHLQGNLSVRGMAGANDPSPGELVINGMLVEGRVTALAGNLGGLQLSHCTLVPGAQSLVANSGASAGMQNAQLQIVLQNTVCGQVDLEDTVPAFAAQNSIIDRAAGGEAISAPGAHVQLENCTIFGRTTARQLDASNVIFGGQVTVERRQEGCVRYSFLPDGSSTPRRYRCQPDLALERRAADLGLPSSASLTTAERQRVVKRVKPEFVSNTYGDAAYAQLDPSSANQLPDGSICTGADNGSEMGVFNFLMQPQREANLRASLEEYLRFGLEAGIFFVN